MSESLSKRVAQGLSVDVALISILVLIPVCVVVLTLLRYFIIGRERDKVDQANLAMVRKRHQYSYAFPKVPLC
jgi:uncharacterized BrkB/YihY/UPF0761 family membrane protein